MYCSKCGKKLSDTNRFCSGCGVAIMSKTCEGSPCKKKRGGFWFWIIWTLIILSIEICTLIAVISEVDRYNRDIYYEKSMIRAFDRANAYNKYQTNTREIECPDGYTRVFAFNFVKDSNSWEQSEEWLVGDDMGKQVAYRIIDYKLTLSMNQRAIMIILWILGLLLGILVWQLPYWFCKWFKRGTSKVK